MVASSGVTPVRAVSDGDDRLIAAEEPLAGLQLRCGGELPGTIAVPALLETVRKSRHYRLKLARTLAAQDGTHAVTAWIEVEPRRDGEPGCEIVLRNWRSAPLPEEDPAEIASLHGEIDRQLAELTAQLDGSQRLLAVEFDAPDLEALGRAMESGMGRPWTEFVTVEGSSHHQPLHWRLLDGVSVVIPGSERSWRATLLPQPPHEAEPDGFELLLAANEPLPQRIAPPEPQAPRGQSAAFRNIGREIAPVLRQPIARIIANAETIRTRLAGPLAREYANYAADIAAAGQHLLGLVDDLADLEVVEAEDFSTSAELVDLAEVSHQAAGILGVRASEKNIVIAVAAEGRSFPAFAEFRRVLQIMLNLIGNAIRYSPEGSRITIALTEDERGVRATVTDEGPGIPAEDRARVFEKFERLGRSGDGGSGLGLYISRRLARAMGGELTVDGDDGKGASFVLDLPVFPVAEGDEFANGRMLPRLPRIAGVRAAGTGESAPTREASQD